MKIKTKHIILIFPLLLVGCGTIFQGYYYDVKLNVPENTMDFDSNKFEIPIETDITYKTNDTVKYIELRTSEKHELNFVYDAHLKKLIIEPKTNNTTLFFDIISSVFFVGIPIIVDYANGNLYKFDEITLTKDDFNNLVENNSRYVGIYDRAYQNKITADSILSCKRGLVFDNSRVSLFLGICTSSLGNNFSILSLSQETFGIKFRLNDEFEIAGLTEYTDISEYDKSSYSGFVSRFSIGTRYFPINNFPWFLSLGINEFYTQFSKDSLANNNTPKTYQNMYGITIGTGYGGKWWFVDGTYSLGFNKIRLEGYKPFLVSYFSFGIYFNLPI